MMNQIQSFFQPWFVFLADDPALRLMQSGMLLCGFAVVFLVFYTTRDILLRTHSFWYMFISILLVALIPIAGFLLYLLIRPARTLKEKEIEELLRELYADKSPSTVSKKPKPKKTKKSASTDEDISL